MATLENLPKEIMIEILSRLPPESLFQFKYVSKFWNALIKDPKNSSFLQHKYILLERLLTDGDSGKTQLILSILTLDPSMSLLDDFHLPLPFDWNQSSWPLPFEDDGTPIPFDTDPDYYKDFHIQGHSHGLVCLSKFGRDIILCNPTTKEMCKLPPSIIAFSDPLNYIYNTMGNAVGFGYDPKSRDFKVVRLVCFDEGSNYLGGEIFDLSKNRWREIQVSDTCCIDIVPYFGMYHEGTYYWMSCSFGSPFLQCFDLSEEVLNQIWLPESVGYWSFEDHVEILNESIVMFHYSWRENKLESTLDIWKMENDDKSGDVSWSILFIIDLQSGIQRALMFVSCNQLLMITKEGQVVLYNIKTHQFKELPIKGYIGWASTATYFMKSLLSVKGEN